MLNSSTTMKSIKTGGRRKKGTLSLQKAEVSEDGPSVTPITGKHVCKCLIRLHLIVFALGTTSILSVGYIKC